MTSVESKKFQVEVMYSDSINLRLHTHRKRERERSKTIDVKLYFIFWGRESKKKFVLCEIIGQNRTRAKFIKGQERIAF